MTTEGIEGISIETRNYGATAAFWKSLGFEPQIETEHGSGHWVHPAGGPYVFIAERLEGDLSITPVLTVADAASFDPARPLDLVHPFTPQHWGVLEAVAADPDGRPVSLQAPGGTER